MKSTAIPVCTLAMALAALGSLCPAQARPHARPVEPTLPELVEYVRSALLSLSPEDGVNDTVDAGFDPVSRVLRIITPVGYCDLHLDALNTNNTLWDEFNASDSTGPRPTLLRLTLVSISGRQARTCYDSGSRPDPAIQPNRARLLFSAFKAGQVPHFQEGLERAFKRLVVLCGGIPERRPY